METYKAVFFIIYLIVVFIVYTPIKSKLHTHALSFLIITLIILHTIYTPGGFDYGVYDYHVTNEINAFTFLELFQFYSSEIYIYPFFKLAAFFNVDFQYFYGLSVIILTFLLVHFSGDIPKKRMKLAFIALLVSPASPFLLGNTIRQGLASVFLVGVIGHMIQSKKIKLLLLYFSGSLFHKTILLALFPIVKYKKYIFATLIFVVFAALFSNSIRQPIITFFANTLLNYHADEEFSIVSLFVRMFIFVIPVLLTFFETDTTVNKKIGIILVLTVVMSLMFWMLSGKAANRFSYYLAPISIAYVLHKVKLKHMGYVILVNVLISVLMIVFGRFDQLWLHIEH